MPTTQIVSPVFTEPPASALAKPLPLLIIDSHPIQYKAPVYRALAKAHPGNVFVLYGCDASVRGQLEDPDFGKKLDWGADLLKGYPHAFLSTGKDISLGRFNALSGKGLYTWIRQLRPLNILLASCNYRMDLYALLLGKLFGSDLWIRHDTNDQAFVRSWLKAKVRFFYYYLGYSFIDGAFSCGKGHYRHLTAHGFDPSRIFSSPHAVPDPIAQFDRTNKMSFREKMRTQWGCDPATKVVLFCGKFIAKKQPNLIVEALEILPESERANWLVVFAGSGPLEDELKRLCVASAIRAEFTGFLNQADLPAYYLAADIMVLPSRRMGETWGLVVNEALQAGCAVALSDAVGSHEEFRDWERVSVFGSEDAAGLKEALGQLARYHRDFDWARPEIEAYSVDAAAAGIAERIFPD